MGGEPPSAKPARRLFSFTWRPKVGFLAYISETVVDRRMWLPVAKLREPSPIIWSRSRPDRFRRLGWGERNVFVCNHFFAKPWRAQILSYKAEILHSWRSYGVVGPLWKLWGRGWGLPPPQGKKWVKFRRSLRERRKRLRTRKFAHWSQYNVQLCG